MEYKDLALESGISNWGRVPALNCTPSFINDLADAVVEALPSAMTMSSTTTTTTTTTATTASEELDYDPMRYIVRFFFGSIVAFLLLFSGKVWLALRNNVL